MTYNSGTNSIVDEIRDLVDADSNSYPLADITRRVNMGLDHAAGIIVGADERWEWDDTNKTDLPIATTDLTSGQQDYAFDSTHLIVRRVTIKDENGDWKSLEPIDQRDIHVAPVEYFKDDGTPEQYDKLGESIFLYPAPDYTQSGSLKVYFQRNFDKFTTGDTTKEPGFIEMYHDYLVYYAAEPYAAKYKQELVPWIQGKIQERETQIAEFYAKRNEDTPKRITAKPIRHR